MNPKVYSSEDFESKFTFSGELGFKWSPEKTFFRLWAPTAEDAKLRLFKSGDPAKRAAAIVKAVTNYQDAGMLAELSTGLGEAMVGINPAEIKVIMEERGI